MLFSTASTASVSGRDYALPRMQGPLKGPSGGPGAGPGGRPERSECLDRGPWLGQPWPGRPAAPSHGREKAEALQSSEQR